jgi:hypothetical protein
MKSPKEKSLILPPNKHRNTLCKFMIDSNCCMLNGRDNINNDFTFVGPQGSSVVDYCIVPHEYLGSFSKFQVPLVSDLLSKSGVLREVESTACRPDLSLLYWAMELDLCFSKEVVGTMQASFTVFDRSCKHHLQCLPYPVYQQTVCKATGIS